MREPISRLIALAVLAACAPTATAAWPASTGPTPRGLALDSAGNVWVANFGSDTVTRISNDGTSSGTTPGYACATVGQNPHSVVVDQNDNVYVTIYGSGLNRVAKITGKTVDCSAGTVTPSWATTGSSPTELTIDSTGTLFTGNGNSTVTKITPGGVSSGTTPGWSWSSTGQNPRGIGLDAAGNVYTASSDLHTVTKITPSGSPLGTTGTPSGTSPGFAWASLAAGAAPWGIVLDSAGNVYTANTGSNSVSKITPAGTVEWTVAVGSGPYGITIDSAGNVYTANNGSNNVSKVAPNGTVASTIAVGAGPFDIEIDGSGNIYTTNSSGNTVSKVTGAEPAAPATPSAPTAVAGEEKATVTAPVVTPSARYGTPTSFVITAVGDPSRTCTVTLPATTCDVTGLTPGTTYTFTAEARLSTWTSAPSTASNAVTPTAPAPSPAPTPTPDPTPAANPAGSTQASAGASSSTPATQPAALAATLLPSRRRVMSGQRVTTAIRLRNTGGTAATSATGCMTVPWNLVITSAPGALRSNRTVCFAMGSIPAGGTATRTVTLRAIAAVATVAQMTGGGRAAGISRVSASPVAVSIIRRPGSRAVTG